MTPKCYFCGREIGPRGAWVMVPRPGGFSVAVAACSDCAKNQKVAQ